MINDIQNIIFKIKERICFVEHKTDKYVESFDEDNFLCEGESYRFGQLNDGTWVYAQCGKPLWFDSYLRKLGGVLGEHKTQRAAQAELVLHLHNKKYFKECGMDNYDF